jgi:pentose-5-phosphate-3-epimerase
MNEIFLTNTCPPDLAELTRRSEAFTHYAVNVQLDVCDNVFAPALSWPYAPGQWRELERLASGEKLPYADSLFYECHLMVQDPRELGCLLAKAGCRRIIPHVESFADASAARAALAAYREAGAHEIGVALLLETPLSVVEPLADELNAVQLMSIRTLGAQGAPFDSAIFGRVEELHRKHPDLVISIDGGVSETAIQDLVRAGASRFGIGSAIMKKPDPATAYQQLLTLANGV